MSDYLADTTVLIDHLRDRQHVINLVDRLSAVHRLCCCAATICEIYAGMRTHERRRTETFLSGSCRA
jgi:predicted nucleic acid-binding protein